MSIQPVQSAQTYSPVKKAAKTVIKGAIVASAVATTLALGAKSGKFAVNEKTNKFAAKALPYLEKAGNFINKKAGEVVDKFAQTGIKEKITGSKTYIVAKEKAEGILTKIRDSKLLTNIREARLQRFVDKFKTNIGKYNPDKASAADKAAETFNYFVK